MKKQFLTLTAVILAVLVSLPVNAQSLKIGVGGGITQNLNTTNLLASAASGGELKLGTDYHYGLKAKVGLPLLPITIVGSWFYNSLKTDTEVAGFKYEYDASFSTLGIGAEMGFIPGPISPYLGLDILYTTLGESTFKATGSPDFTMGGNNRFGLGIGAGIDLGIIPKLNIDVMAKYQMNNLFGKEDGEEKLNTFNATVLIMFNAI